MEQKLGLHPDTGMDVFLSAGRYGYFLRLGNYDDPAFRTFRVNMHPLREIDLNHALKVIDDHDAGRCANNSTRRMPPFGINGFAKHDADFRDRVVRDRPGFLAALVDIGNREAIEDCAAHHFACAHFTPKLADIHRVWWQGVCGHLSDDELVGLYKGLVLCEREMAWGHGSPTPTANVYRFVKR